MMPQDRLSVKPVIGNWFVPDDKRRPKFLTDYEIGGIALSDPSYGLQYRQWEVHVVDEVTINVYGPPDPAVYYTLTAPEPLKEVSVAFDQNMKPAVAYIAGNTTYLNWYNNVIAQQVTTNLGTDIQSVFLTMDDKRPQATSENRNDILLFLLKGAGLYYAQQRERYEFHRNIYTWLYPPGRILRVGMSDQMRIQIEVGEEDRKPTIPLKYVIPVSIDLSRARGL